MKYLKLILIILLLITSAMMQSYSKTFTNPQGKVYAFIHDYYEWNLSATQSLSEDNNFSPKNEYDKLLDKCCTKRSDRIGYDSYGQNSLHIPESEKIVSYENINGSVVVKTSTPSRFSYDEDEKKYFEYHLCFYKGEYRISEVYEISDSGVKRKTL